MAWQDHIEGVLCSIGFMGRWGPRHMEGVWVDLFIRREIDLRFCKASTYLTQTWDNCRYGIGIGG